MKTKYFSMKLYLVLQMGGFYLSLWSHSCYFSFLWFSCHQKYLKLAIIFHRSTLHVCSSFDLIFFLLLSFPGSQLVFSSLIDKPPKISCLLPSTPCPIWLRFLGPEDALEEDKVTHSSNLVWRIPLTEDHGGLRPWSCTESDITEAA